MAKKNTAMFIFMDNGYLIGLPARDMTEDEWLSYPSELTEPALAQKLYKVVGADNIEKQVDHA